MMEPSIKKREEKKMAEIKSIMCCCGSGLGSSMMVQMNIEKALKNMGITVPVRAERVMASSSATPEQAETAKEKPRGYPLNSQT